MARYLDLALAMVGVCAVNGCGGRSSLDLGDESMPNAGASVGGSGHSSGGGTKAAAGSAGQAQRTGGHTGLSFGGALQAGGVIGTGGSLALGGTTHAGGAPGTGASLALGGAAHSGGAVGIGGTSSGLVCGTKITDLEDGTGRICEGVEGRRGVWYAFNDGTGVQWPVPTTPGVAIETSAILPERNGSRSAIHSYASGFTYWGAGVGFDVAFDGTTYRLYDASGYDGISFWAKGNVSALGLSFEFRVSTADTTLTKYGGRCPSEPCRPPLLKSIHPHDEWTQYWVPFGSLGTLPRSELTNVQFKSYAAFDLWVDDVAFFMGPADCCPVECQTDGLAIDRKIGPFLQRYIGSESIYCIELGYVDRSFVQSGKGGGPARWAYRRDLA